MLHGHVFCKIFYAASPLGAKLSIGIILIISLERFFAIMYPLSTGLTRKNVFKLLLISIVIAIVNVVPLVVYAELDSTIPVCRIALPINKGRRDSLIYSWSQAFICFLMPAVLILILNIKMVVHWKRPAPNTASTNPELRQQRQRQATLLVC